MEKQLVETRPVDIWDDDPETGKPCDIWDDDPETGKPCDCISCSLLRREFIENNKTFIKWLKNNGRI